MGRVSHHLAITNLRLFCREEDCRFLEQRIAAEKGRCARLEEELKEAQRLLKAGEESHFATFFFQMVNSNTEIIGVVYNHRD